MAGPSWHKYPRSAGLWLGLPILVTLIGLLPVDLITHSTLLLLYLCAVLFTSLRADQGTVMACGISSMLLFVVFITEPRFSLQIRAPQDEMAALVFVVIALLTGLLSGRLNQQLAGLQDQKAFLSAQVQFNQALQDAQDESVIPPLLAEHFGALFKHRVGFMLGKLPAAGREPAGTELQWTVQGAGKLPPEHEVMLLSLKEQVHNALARLTAERVRKEAERKSDEDRLRSALLSSVSHDLKTPLVTMLGAATSLRDLRADLSPEDSAELLESIISESRRLESYIQNLLDMTRLGHGQLALSRAWVSVEEIYHVVEKRVARLHRAHRLRYRQDGDIPVMHVHAALIEQGLFNVIDNALKAGGVDNEVVVSASWQADTVTVHVCDHGPGLPRSEWEAVFDQFYTFSLGDRYEKGTGLGLAICRSIFRVHGGEARIVPAPAGFAHCVELTLPVKATEEQNSEHD